MKLLVPSFATLVFLFAFEIHADLVRSVSPQDITKEWSVCIAEVEHIDASTAEDEVTQRGEVTLKIVKTLHGKKLSKITVPYAFINLSLWKTKDRKKRAALPSSFDFTQWPELDDLKKPFLLIAINPNGIDNVSTDRPAGIVGAIVDEVNSEFDPIVAELLGNIPGAAIPVRPASRNSKEARGNQTHEKTKTNSEESPLARKIASGTSSSGSSKRIAFYSLAAVILVLAIYGLARRFK